VVSDQMKPERCNFWLSLLDSSHVYTSRLGLWYLFWSVNPFHMDTWLFGMQSAGVPTSTGCLWKAPGDQNRSKILPLVKLVPRSLSGNLFNTRMSSVNYVYLKINTFNVLSIKITFKKNFFFFPQSLCPCSHQAYTGKIVLYKSYIKMGNVGSI
jgi:hypothetical protein